LQADSRNEAERTSRHYDRDVRPILEKWQSDSIFACDNHVEGMYDTAIPLYTNVMNNLTRHDPRGIARSHLVDLHPYNKLAKSVA
jgi:hypothetical protein